MPLHRYLNRCRTLDAVVTLEPFYQGGGNRGGVHRRVTETDLHPRAELRRLLHPIVQLHARLGYRLGVHGLVSVLRHVGFGTVHGRHHRLGGIGVGSHKLSRLPIQERLTAGERASTLDHLVQHALHVGTAHHGSLSGRQRAAHLPITEHPRGASRGIAPHAPSHTTILRRGVVRAEKQAADGDQQIQAKS